MFTQSDFKHWFPIEQTRHYIADIIPDGAKVLEIGACHIPFPKATTYVDYVYDPKIDNVVCDVTKERLPFEDKSFDFVYCRHVIEDLWNPFLVLSEMQRVAKAGYIETPSIAQELARGVGAGSFNFRGHCHHHWFVYNDSGVLKFISKLPWIEHVEFDEEQIEHMLKTYPIYWNTYFQWTDKFDFEHVQGQYPMLQNDIISGLHVGYQNANAFTETIIDHYKE
jgi:hypothetical protein